LIGNLLEGKKCIACGQWDDNFPLWSLSIYFSHLKCYQIHVIGTVSTEENNDFFQTSGKNITCDHTVLDFFFLSGKYISPCPIKG